MSALQQRDYTFIIHDDVADVNDSDKHRRLCLPPQMLSKAFEECPRYAGPGGEMMCGYEDAEAILMHVLGADAVARGKHFCKQGISPAAWAPALQDADSVGEPISYGEEGSPWGREKIKDDLRRRGMEARAAGRTGTVLTADTLSVEVFGPEALAGLTYGELMDKNGTLAPAAALVEDIGSRYFKDDGRTASDGHLGSRFQRVKRAVATVAFGELGIQGEVLDTIDDDEYAHIFAAHHRRLRWPPGLEGPWLPEPARMADLRQRIKYASAKGEGDHSGAMAQEAARLHLLLPRLPHLATICSSDDDALPEVVSLLGNVLGAARPLTAVAVGADDARAAERGLGAEAVQGLLAQLRATAPHLAGRELAHMLETELRAQRRAARDRGTVASVAASGEAKGEPLGAMPGCDREAFDDSFGAPQRMLVDQIVALMGDESMAKGEALRLALNGKTAGHPTRQPNATVLQVAWGHLSPTAVPALSGLRGIGAQLPRLLGATAADRMAPGVEMAGYSLARMAEQLRGKRWAPDWLAAAKERGKATLDLESAPLHLQAVARGDKLASAPHGDPIDHQTLYTVRQRWADNIDWHADLMGILGWPDDKSGRTVRDVALEVLQAFATYGGGPAGTATDVKRERHVGAMARALMLGLLGEAAERLNRVRYTTAVGGELSPAFVAANSPAKAAWAAAVEELRTKAAYDRATAVWEDDDDDGGSSAADSDAPPKRKKRKKGGRPKETTPPKGKGKGAGGEERPAKGGGAKGDDAKGGGAKGGAKGREAKAGDDRPDSLPTHTWNGDASEVTIGGVVYSKAAAEAMLAELGAEPGAHCLEVLLTRGRVKGGGVDHAQCQHGHGEDAPQHVPPNGWAPSKARADAADLRARGGGKGAKAKGAKRK